MILLDQKVTWTSNSLNRKATPVSRTERGGWDVDSVWVVNEDGTKSNWKLTTFLSYFGIDSDDDL